MNNQAGPSHATAGLDENILPVELQTKNVVNPSFVISAPSALNGAIPKSETVIKRQIDQEQPYVKITEQPQQRGFRFRYECEGPSHGGLQGTRSERSRKSYPAIRIMNYSGAARIVVSLVTDEESPRSHAHKLLGSNCKNGLCTVEIQANLDDISFPNLSVLHVTRKKLVDVLTERILDSIKLNKKLKANNMNFEPDITREDRQQAKQQANAQSKNMQLNVVRLCFQVFLRNPDGSFSKMLTPVVSQPIYDSKSPGASALKICRMDKYGGCCSGNEEVFLLCEKVQKDDIMVRFVEQNPDGSVKWEAYGNFGPLDVHRQYAIVFKTPAYYNTNIDKAVNVLIMLQRKSDHEVSEPKAFTYFPQNRDKDNIASKKRKRIIPLDGYGDFGEGGLDPDAGDGGGSGGDGGSGGGGSGTNNSNTNSISQSMVMFQPSSINNATLQNADLPKPVSDAIQEERETIQERADTDTHSDDHPDSDIEVDAAPMSPLLHSKETSSPQAPPGDGQSSTSQDKKSQDRTVSLDWTDSGLLSMEVKVNKTSSEVSDSRSESETKTDVVSETVRSDEGFSETSEEAAMKTHLPTSKSTNAACEGRGCLELTATLRQVTGHMAERTLTALADFSETGDIRHLLLVQRHLLAVTNHNGDLPLHLAIINNQPEVLRNLLDVTCTLPKPDKFVNALNLLSQTPLHLATIVQCPSMVENLLHCGADPTIADRHGNTAAHLAVMYRAPSCLQSLVKYVRPGVDRLDPFPELDYLNFEGYSPVHLAVMESSVDMLHTLVFGQADVSIPDGKSGKTALHHAVENDDLPVAGYLLMEAAADVNARTFDGNTALHLACARQLVAMVALLVTAGADINCENEEIPDPEDSVDDRPGLRPIHYAEDNQQIIDLLLGENSGTDPQPNRKSHTQSLLSSSQQLHRLSQFLDPDRPGQDVVALADQLGYSDLTTTLESLRARGLSATSFLLEYVELNEGGLDSVKSGLKAIDRGDLL